MIYSTLGSLLTILFNNWSAQQSNYMVLIMLHLIIGPMRSNLPGPQCKSFKNVDACNTDMLTYGCNIYLPVQCLNFSCHNLLKMGCLFNIHKVFTSVQLSYSIVSYIPFLYSLSKWIFCYLNIINLNEQMLMNDSELHW